ncbi:cytosolic non-specific dipeptidase isoform X2 [Colletes gigas]|uniref:cytosolic non-specific dipeptidase isoform X2 n=1 Tax=Colletes gigas TaxID=935657 RepID=UPI001C9B6BBF|nr:cytosolic non-specific dipeptidase isoform X2 [Colletes gigas]
MASEIPTSLKSLFSYIDKHKAEYIDNLKEAVAIKSVSAWPDHRNEIIKMMKWAEVKLKDLGATTELVDIGKQTLPDKSEIPLPPVLLGTLGCNPQKKTVLLYGHLDVQPALKEDGWDTEPFTLVEKDEKLFGRGSTDDKGPVLCWIHALQAYKAIEVDIPVNLKFVFEGMEEAGSEGLDDLLWARKDTFLQGVDYIQLLMHRWRQPSLSLHGIEGAFSEPGSKTVIPRKVIGKFSIRIVPDMTPEETTEKVITHLKKKWATRGSPNKMDVSMHHGGKPWSENPDHPHYVAARKATKHVYKVEPDLSREGGSIPVTLTFQDVTGKNVLLLPVGAGDDGAHSQNEKLNIRNYIEGTKLLGAYLYEVGQL